jgi:hypothetical protein
VDRKIAVLKEKFELGKMVDKFSDLEKVCIYTDTFYGMYEGYCRAMEKVNKESR